MLRRTAGTMLVTGILLALGVLNAGRANPSTLPPWTPPLNLSETAGRSTWPQVAARVGGEETWVVWTEDAGEALQEEILLRRRLGSDDGWSPPLDLSLSPAIDEASAIYLEESGVLHVAWTRRSVLFQTTELIYRRWDGGNWASEEVLDRNPVFPPSPYGLFFVRDPGGDLCLFLHIGSGVCHTCLRAGGWEPLSPWVYVPGLRGLGDLVLGPDGLFHVAALGKNEYDRFGWCDDWLDDAYHTTTDGTSWGALENVSYTGTIAFDLGLVFDQAGRLHFFWSDIHPLCSLDSRRAAVYERVRGPGGWEDRREVTTYNEGQVVEDLAAEMDPAGRIHVAWSEGIAGEGGLAILYRRWQEGDWEPEEVVHFSPEENLNVDLALSGPNLPVLVWEEGNPSAEEIVFSQRGLLYRLFLPRLERSYTAIQSRLGPPATPGRPGDAR